MVKRRCLMSCNVLYRVPPKDGGKNTWIKMKRPGASSAAGNASKKQKQLSLDYFKVKWLTQSGAAWCSAALMLAVEKILIFQKLAILQDWRFCLFLGLRFLIFSIFQLGGRHRPKWFLKERCIRRRLRSGQLALGSNPIRTLQRIPFFGSLFSSGRWLWGTRCDVTSPFISPVVCKEGFSLCRCFGLCYGIWQLRLWTKSSCFAISRSATTDS